jgi:hypothetical protein
MKEPEKFDTAGGDSQATEVQPVSAAKFDTMAYAGYADALHERIRLFLRSK